MKIALALAVILTPLLAQAAPPAPMVSVVRITPGASPAKVLAFQNTSSSVDVIVRKIEIVNASTMAVTSGLMQFWVYGSTSVAHSETTSQTAYKYNTVLASQPSYISVSTKPASATYEGDAAPLDATAYENLTGAKPFLAPLIVNLDEGATSNFAASWTQEVGELPLVLPAGEDRALVFEKRQLGTSDYTDGQAEIRIFCTLR